MIQVIDIETIAGPKALTIEAPESFLNTGIRANFKPETAEAHRAKNEVLWETERHKVGALDWRLGQIVATAIVREAPTPTVLVYLTGGESALFNLQGPNGATAEVRVHPRMSEVDLIAASINTLTDSEPIHGFSCADFDLPYLRMRAALKGLSLTWPWEHNKWNPKRSGVIDWQQILCGNNMSKATGWPLSRYGEFFDLDWQAVDTGSSIQEWHEAGDWDSIARHVANDVLATYALAERFQGAI